MSDQSTYYSWRGIPCYYQGNDPTPIYDVCRGCDATGIKGYGSTATWMGGVGGQAFTNGPCDVCWGSGTSQPWPSHREFYMMKQRIEQLEKKAREDREGTS